MDAYEPCEVVNVSTLSLEVLLDRALAMGTVITILVRPEDPVRKYHRVVGTVERRIEKGSQWIHVVKASSKRPWPAMFIYDVIYQALVVSGARLSPGLMHAQNSDTFKDGPEQGYTYTVADPRQDAGEEEETFLDEFDPVVYRSLAWFAPFHELNDLLRQFIAHKTTAVRKPAGTTLVERGSDDDVSIYLVEGTLELEPGDGNRVSVAGGTERAQLPISQLRPHAYTVTAATDVTVLLFSQRLVRELTRIIAKYISRPGIEVSEEALPTSLRRPARGAP